MSRLPTCRDERVRDTERNRGRQRGFTVIEALMVVTIAAILAAVALPNLRGLIVSTRVKTAASDLHTSLLLARSEAITRNASIDVVPVSPSNWAQGWTVRLAGGGAVLEQQQAYESITFTGPASTVTYKGNGRLSDPGTLTFTMSASGDATVPARCVYIDPGGRPAVRTDTNRNPSDGCN